MGALSFKVSDATSGDRVVGVANLAVGAAAVFLGVRALVLRPDPLARNANRLNIVPTALANARPAIGFQGNFRF